MTALYLLLRHVEMAAYLAYHGAPFTNDRASLALWSMLNTAANLYRDHNGSADALRAQAASWARVDDPQAAGIARAAALAATVAEGADMRSALADGGVSVESLCAACPSLRGAVDGKPDPDALFAEYHESLSGTADYAIPPDPDSAPYTLTPAAAELLPRGAEPVICGANVDRKVGSEWTQLVCALPRGHHGDHNTASDGGGDGFRNVSPGSGYAGRAEDVCSE